jgi:large subunit ribosomal protein L35Ae
LYRLYQKATFLGFKRAQRAQHEQQALVKIQGVNDRKSSAFYFGKRVAYIYRAKNTKNGTNFKCIWGKVMQAHGNSGTVRAKFAKNLPPRAISGNLRVMLYPNRSI